MTASKLQSAALIRFAEQGFNATTMNEIASDVGIKKASIYAHFRNKDELFLSLIPLMIDNELHYVKAMIHGGEQVKTQLYTYLESIDSRFDSSHHVQFWLRILFAPPIHLYDQVVTPMHQFMDGLEDYIREVIAASTLQNLENGLSVSVITSTYMAMIDALQTELLFGGHARYEKRLQAIWQMFEMAITAKSA